MPDTTRAEWMALLRRQLHEAEEREQRWRQLGEQQRKTQEEAWKQVATIRRSEVELFSLLVERNESNRT
jgi:hypothetical protein